MIESTISGETARLSPGNFRTIGRILEMFVMGSIGVGLLLLSYNPWYLFGAVIVAFAFFVGAYYCALRAKPEKAKPSEVEKPFGISDHYLITTTNLEKMTVDGVPWDVVGALARLINPSSDNDRPINVTEVELIQHLVSLKCDLERINEFRGKILKNTRVEKTIDPPNPSNRPPSKSEPAARANTLEPSPAVRAP